MKPVEYMSKQELQELNTVELKTYLVYSLYYELQLVDSYSRAEVIKKITEDNKRRATLRAKNPSK